MSFGNKKTEIEGRELRYTAIKVRIYPTPEQAEIMEKTFDACRYIWNRMLTDQQEFYAATDKLFIPTPARYKKDAPFLKEADSQALVAVHQNIQKAFLDFFSDPKRYHHPSFKKKKDRICTYRTYCHHYHGKAPDSVRIEGNGIVLPKVKWVRAKLHRRPLHWWTLQYATVMKNAAGKYYCSLLYQYPAKQPEAKRPAPETTLGLKYSVSHFYVDSEGRAADPPRWMAEAQPKLDAMRQRLSRMVPGSNNYNKLLQRIRLLHEHIANQRLDYAHKESRRIANAWDAVCVRTDNLAEMSQRMKYGNVMDSGFGRFKYDLEYKLTRQGKQYISVDKATPTSQTCHRCGCVNTAMNRRNKRWTCPDCGAVLDREVNAAINIKNAGLAQLSA